mmetsp:Transcript_9092/g.26168  ORF Transcript_9092/g.26168 Transcript_9092/m.26168 type:complete len:181 (-) Transcript_9092:896-1438(-)
MLLLCFHSGLVSAISRASLLRDVVVTMRRARLRADAHFTQGAHDYANRRVDVKRLLHGTLAVSEKDRITDFIWQSTPASYLAVRPSTVTRPSTHSTHPRHATIPTNTDPSLSHFSTAKAAIHQPSASKNFSTTGRQSAPWVRLEDTGGLMHAHRDACMEHWSVRQPGSQAAARGAKVGCM